MQVEAEKPFESRHYKTYAMKLKKNHFISCLLGAGLCSAIFISACQKETGEPAEPMDGDEMMANAGKIHNEMITYFYANREVTPSKGSILTAEVLDLSWEYLLHNGYESSFTPGTRNAVEDHLKSPGLKTTGRTGFTLDTASFISQLSETGLYSKHFLKEMKKVMALAHLKDDRSEIREYVNSNFKNSRFRSESDITGQHLYINIFNASYDFWEAWETSSLKGANLKRSSWVIINDGIGGLLGMVFGPVGSIVTATVFSVGTNEEIQD